MIRRKPSAKATAKRVEARLGRTFANMRLIADLDPLGYVALERLIKSVAVQASECPSAYTLASRMGA